MKVGIDSYCYHRFFGEVYENQVPPAHPMSQEDFLRRAIRWGVDGVSLETCFLPSLEDSYLAGLRELIGQAGLEVVVAWGHPDGFAAGRHPERMDSLRRMFQVCHLLGASVMRVVGSSAEYRGEPHGPQLAQLARIFGECARQAEDEGLRLAMENHNDFNTVELLELLSQVDHPSFGITLDMGNVLRMGDDPVAAARQLAPHIYATHTKDVARLKDGRPSDWYYYASRPVGQGEVDVIGVVDVLEGAGYQGLFAVEVDYLPEDCADEDRAVEQSVRYLQDLQRSRPRAASR
jgi:sugar phosphate isomerase/epimerase